MTCRPFKTAAWVLPLLAALWLAAGPFARANERGAGTWVAAQACEALQSMRKGSNPGQVRLVPGKAYAVAERGGANGQWLRVQVPDAPGETLRWVPADCGTAAGPLADPGAGSPGPVAGAARQDACRLPDRHDAYVLALTWQPGFCEHVPYKGRKPECDHMADGRLVVGHLTLHGLWPNRAQCGTDYGHCPARPLQLKDDTVAYIQPWMPNFRYERVFGEYQWHKHGSCQTGMDADTYFRRAVDALKVVNDSAVGEYIRRNIGGTISRQGLEERLQSATGQARYRHSISLHCSGRFLTELRVRLPVAFRETGTLSDLLGADPPQQPAGGQNCPREGIRIEASGKP
jgi:ribonuclease T2